MQKNKFEMNMFDGRSICFEFNSIIVCNDNIKQSLLKGYLELEAPKPYIIITDNSYSDEEVDILEDASIGDCLMLHKAQPAFGGILI